MSDKIAQIRARHEAGAPGEMPIVALAQADADREFLLAEVDRLTREHDAARAEVERLRTGLDRLARLGNEPDYGNSFGNRLARQVLEAKP